MIRRSLDMAKLWVSKAVSYYKVQGREKSLAEFSNPKGLFTEEEMYILALNIDGIVIAHGIDEKYIGRDFLQLSDSRGNRYYQEVIETANSKGSGVVEYWWLNPVTGHIELKDLYFEKVDDIIICSGVYH
ncbi:MAG: cache domain-containing protein [Syntrophaceae bacterium]|nr:cache domain-containing protein [Syntrophaceae bacterium]